MSLVNASRVVDFVCENGKLSLQNDLIMRLGRGQRRCVAESCCAFYACELVGWSCLLWVEVVSSAGSVAFSSSFIYKGVYRFDRSAVGISIIFM